MCNSEMQPCQRVTWDIQHPSFIEYGLYSAMLRGGLITTIHFVTWNGIGNIYIYIAILEMYDQFYDANMIIQHWK